MRNPFASLVPLALSLPLAACQLPMYAPGPGMAAADVNADAARCRLEARGMAHGFGFEVSGGPRYTAVAGASMLAIGAIAGAIEQYNNTNDCMQALGWRPVDRTRVATADTLAPIAPQPSGPPLPPATAPEPQIAAAGIISPSGPPAAPGSVTLAVRQVAVGRTLSMNPPPATRRPFLAKAATVTADTAVLLRMDAPRGVVLKDVLPGGVAASSGLRAGDVILTWNNTPVSSLEMLLATLDHTDGHSLVTAGVWRADAMTALTLRF